MILLVARPSRGPKAALHTCSTGPIRRSVAPYPKRTRPCSHQLMLVTATSKTLVT